MSNNTIKDSLEALDSERELMHFAMDAKDYDLVEHHANRIITLAGEIRRECFLATHASGEVK